MSQPDQVVVPAILIGNTRVEFTGREGQEVAYDELTFLVSGGKNTIEIKTFRTRTVQINEVPTTYKDLISGKSIVGELTYEFREEWSPRLESTVIKPKIVGFKA